MSGLFLFRNPPEAFLTSRGMLPWDKSRQAAKSRPRLKLAMSGANASTASAVSGPTPGMICSRRTVRFLSPAS